MPDIRLRSVALALARMNPFAIADPLRQPFTRSYQQFILTILSKVVEASGFAARILGCGAAFKPITTPELKSGRISGERVRGSLSSVRMRVSEDANGAAPPRLHTLLFSGGYGKFSRKSHWRITMRKLLILLLPILLLSTQLSARADGVSFGIPLPFPFLFYNFDQSYSSQPAYNGGYYRRSYYYAPGYYPRAYYYGGYYRPWYYRRWYGYRWPGYYRPGW
jgi:hypothetical protein